MTQTEENAFFDYHCTRCDAPFCERVNLMNLALNYLEEGFCITCLAQDHEMTEPAMAEFVQEYVESRECFKTPWDKFAPQALQCPRIPEKNCFCQDVPT